jgi:hypothetical protein
MMDGSHVEKLEEQVGQLREVLRDLSDDKSFDEFLTVIHRPGWTTPPEWMLVEGGVRSMTAMATALNDLKQGIFAGASAVGREDTSQ